MVSLVSSVPLQCGPGCSRDMTRACSGDQRLTDRVRQIHFSFERNKQSKVGASRGFLTDVLYGSLIVGAEFLVSHDVI